MAAESVLKPEKAKEQTGGLGDLVWGRRRTDGDLHRR